ncbi:MAG: NUDIX domain-containing protein [Alphaproteobacteria bacterium]
MLQNTVCIDKNGGSTTVETSHLKLRNAAYALILHNNHILLCPHYDFWTLPGGGIELGETPHQALQREVFEETGLTSITINDVLHVHADFYTSEHDKFLQCLRLIYVCSNPVGTLSTDNLDGDEKNYAKKAEWVEIEKARKLPTFRPLNDIGLSNLINKALKVQS